MTVAETLAAFLIKTGYDDLPEQAVDHAAMIVASTFASAACGTNIESAAIIRDLTQDRGGRPDASIWFDGGAKLPIVSAARVNAMMSDAAASDDSDLRNIVHAGTPLTATALAVAERTGASGREILAAIVLGYEAAGRIGEAIMPHFNYRGHHGCMGAAFGAATAAARLLGLDATQTAHTIALSATSVGGLTIAANTSVAREYHAGTVTLLGLEAALAAQRGYTAELSILEAKRGFCDLYAGTDGSNITEGLGDSWDIVTDMAIKLVPGGHPYHALAEAAANAARDSDIDAADITAITASRPGMTTLTGPLHPKDLIDMAHSPAYFLAAGAADKQFGWANATQEKIDDPVIHALIDKVAVGPEPTENADAYRQGATVTIDTSNGRSVTNTVLIPTGAGCLGIDWADIDAKYRALAPSAPMTDGQVDASLKAIHAFRDLAHIATLIDLLHQS